jgi:hypothetical protein
VEKQTELDVSSTKDRTISPDLERWYATSQQSQVGSTASHSVYVSRPKEVAAVIEEAASHTLEAATEEK